MKRLIPSIMVATLASGCASARSEDDRFYVEQTVRDRLANDALKLGEASTSTRAGDERIQGELEASRAVAIALERSPAARAALATLGIERATAVGQALVSNPSVEAEARFREDGSDPALEFSVSQNFTDLITPRRTIERALEHDRRGAARGGRDHSRRGVRSSGGVPPAPSGPRSARAVGHRGSSGGRKSPRGRGASHVWEHHRSQARSGKGFVRASTGREERRGASEPHEP